MKSHRQVLTLHVPGRTGFVNITEEVAAAVRASGVQEGLCLVNAMHITASVFINDEEAGLKQDYLRWLERLAPFNAGADPATGGYLHNRTGEDNGDAHHKRQVMGREVVVAITEGRLDFGPWEQVFYGEFDGGRDKRILIKVIGA
jgi:secondary thiamine-phosphate synthase enzyme